MLTNTDRTFILTGVAEFLETRPLLSERRIGQLCGGGERMISDLRQGRQPKAGPMIALLERLQLHWADQLADEECWLQEQPTWNAAAPQRVAA
ncbi:hypothetical protein [Erythrobacter rubeus]|uniref:Transcriptional regulator n=1 Tax=Erythrobacter rubeus TaxID=2760803 RepID=A0ABR8KM31_9SPHN|nr:hypothetical protein [Erythrobacter rubeus]MBD2841510.1 hypothetical protein [Erythrobacter rubeus]